MPSEKSSSMRPSGNSDKAEALPCSPDYAIGIKSTLLKSNNNFDVDKYNHAAAQRQDSFSVHSGLWSDGVDMELDAREP